MAMADKTELSTTVCTAVVYLGHDALLRFGGWSRPSGEAPSVGSAS
jgi:hypothetical protein